MTLEFRIEEISEYPQHYKRAMDFMAGLPNLQIKNHHVHLQSQNYTQARMNQKDQKIADEAEIESVTKTEILVIAQSDNEQDLRGFAERLDRFAEFCQAEKLDNSQELILQNPGPDIDLYRLVNIFTFSEPDLVAPQTPPLN